MEIKFFFSEGGKPECRKKNLGEMQEITKKPN